MFKSRYLSTASWTTILSAMGAVNAADAAPIVVTQALTPGASVSASGPAYNGQFDLNAFLPPGTAIANVSATGAFVTAYGYSAAAAQTTDTYTGYSYYSSYTYYVYAGYYYVAGYYSYTCGWISTCYSPYYAPAYTPAYSTTYVRHHTTNVQDVIDDTMLLSVGGQSAQDDTDNETHTTAYNGWTYVGSHNGYYSYSTYYQQEFTQTDILNGPVQVTFALDAANLADLGADGLLDFQISALLGQFTFESISLTAEFQPQTVAVTGPGSTAGTAALLALLFARRRQQRQRGKAAA